MLSRVSIRIWQSGYLAECVRTWSDFRVLSSRPDGNEDTFKLWHGRRGPGGISGDLHRDVMPNAYLRSKHDLIGDSIAQNGFDDGYHRMVLGAFRIVAWR